MIVSRIASNAARSRSSGTRAVSNRRIRLSIALMAGIVSPNQGCRLDDCSKGLQWHSFVWPVVRVVIPLDEPSSPVIQPFLRMWPETRRIGQPSFEVRESALKVRHIVAGISRPRDQQGQSRRTSVFRPHVSAPFSRRNLSSFSALRSNGMLRKFMIPIRPVGRNPHSPRIPRQVSSARANPQPALHATSRSCGFPSVGQNRFSSFAIRLVTVLIAPDAHTYEAGCGSASSSRIPLRHRPFESGHARLDVLDLDCFGRVIEDRLGCAYLYGGWRAGVDQRLSRVVAAAEVPCWSRATACRYATLRASR